MMRKDGLEIQERQIWEPAEFLWDPSPAFVGVTVTIISRSQTLHKLIC